jgi:multicomponent Na+:H+ antiporter subunit D
MSYQFHLAAAIAIPFLGGIGIVMAGARFPNVREGVTLAATLALAWVVWSLLPGVLDGHRAELELFEMLPGLAIVLRAEPLGMLFAALASTLWIVNSIYSIGYMRGNNEHHQTRFYVCFAVALSAAMGVAFAGNLLTLFIFYEVLTLSTYPLVAHKGDAKSVKSARVYLGVLLGTSIGLFLPAIVWTYLVAGSIEFVPHGVLAGKLSGPAVGILLASFAFGIGKAALMPMHRWLPAAMVAPTPVSALLHAVAVVKAGVFAISKVIIYIFGPGFLLSQPTASWLLYAAAFTIIAASAVALSQQNLKRLLAYSTIAQLSYVVMAASLLTPLATAGAAIHIVAHGLGKITLFFTAGAIYTATKNTELHELNGIGRRMPWTMAAFTIGALSMIGLPGTGGFVSKWYILKGAFQADNHIALFTIICSTALTAGYFLPIIYRAWFRPAEPHDVNGRGEGPIPIVVALTLTAAMTLAFFVFNEPALALASSLPVRIE